MKLIPEWSIFEVQIKTHVHNGVEIHESFKRSTTRDELDQLKAKIKAWVDEVVKYLDESFESEENEASKVFITRIAQDLMSPGPRTVLVTKSKLN